MTLATRRILILLLMLLTAGVLSAQETSSEAAPSTGTAEVAESASSSAPEAPATGSSEEVREKFSAVLHRSPPELATILALDPTLLSNEAFLSGYPAVARFIADHPEVRHTPSFYLGEFPVPSDRNKDSLIEEILQGLLIFSTFLLIAFALAWLVRTIIEQQRWSRLARTQSEVHNKILDRFGSSDELLQYIRTAPGTKFLESAPIPLHAGQAAHNAPVSWVMWSIQIGMIVAAAALGLLVVSGRFAGESGQALFAMGVIALCIGLGFVASAAVSMFMARRLGLWQSLETASAERSDGPDS